MYAAKALITGEIERQRRETSSPPGSLESSQWAADKSVLLGDPFKFNAENIDQFDF